MRTELREHYVNLVNGLSLILGPSYEITLHDLSMGDESVIAIANGHITNRTIGSPLTSQMLNYIASERYRHSDYEVNYVSVSMDNKILRSSTIYIKDKNELVGLLCFTFDDSRYRSISNAVLGLCHPDEMLSESNFERIENLETNEETEIVSRNLEELVDTTINNIIHSKNLPHSLKKRHKLIIVAELRKRGVFLIKGAVPEVAEKLESSEATIYRYLNEIENSQTL